MRIQCEEADCPLGIGSVDGPSVLEGVGGQHENHNEQNNDKKENNDWLAILLLHFIRSVFLMWFFILSQKRTRSV